MLKILRSLRSACAVLLLISVPAAWLLLAVAHGLAWRAGGMYGVPPESWALVLLLAGYSHLACLSGVRLLAPRGERVRGPARRCAHGMAYLLGVSAVAFALAFLCRQDLTVDTGELAVLKVAFTHQLNEKLAAQASRQHWNEAAGSERDPNVYVGTEFDYALVPWLRQQYPALRFTALSRIPPKQIIPGYTLPGGANPVEVDRVLAIGPVTFPLWNLASARWRVSLCNGQMTFIRLGSTWYVMSSALDFCI